MTNEEAIERINEHIAIHRYNEPQAIRIAEALQMGIYALEKQIPKKPVMDYQFPEKLRDVIERTNIELAKSKTDCCPVCKRPLEVSKFVQSKTGLRFGNLYCKHCGQAILWE